MVQNQNIYHDINNYLSFETREIQMCEYLDLEGLPLHGFDIMFASCMNMLLDTLVEK